MKELATRYTCIATQGFTGPRQWRRGSVFLTHGWPIAFVLCMFCKRLGLFGLMFFPLSASDLWGRDHQTSSSHCPIYGGTQEISVSWLQTPWRQAGFCRHFEDKLVFITIHFSLTLPQSEVPVIGEGDSRGRVGLLTIWWSCIQLKGALTVAWVRCLTC